MPLTEAMLMIEPGPPFAINCPISYLRHKATPFRLTLSKASNSSSSISASGFLSGEPAALFTATSSLP